MDLRDTTFEIERPQLDRELFDEQLSEIRLYLVVTRPACEVAQKVHCRLRFGHAHSDLTAIEDFS